MIKREEEQKRAKEHFLKHFQSWVNELFWQIECTVALMEDGDVKATHFPSFLVCLYY